MPSLSRRSFVRLLAATALGALALGSPAPASAEIARLELIAPANAGGGWDQTARVMQTVLQEAGLASGVQVQNIPGAGGTIGLAQFATAKKRKGNAVLVAGQTLQGAIITNKSPISPDQVTLLARIVGEHEIVVVPADSPIRTTADLVAKLKEDPGAVSWGGGSAGSTDHILAGLIMKAVGADVSKLNYIAHSGGGEAMASILGGHVTAGVNGVAELMPQIEAGKLRPLAVSAEERVPGLDVPTLKEQGIDVALTNWRGVMAPPQIKDADKKKLGEMIGAMVKSEAWQETLKARGWIDLYQPEEEFAAFLQKDRAQVEGILKEIGLV
jgi:putative tricarboxylic transport membrane protein